MVRLLLPAVRDVESVVLFTHSTNLKRNDSVDCDRLNSLDLVVVEGLQGKRFPPSL